MSGNNMESLLMGGDDSSSGESDDEVNVPTGTATTAASAVTVAAPPPAAAAALPPVSVSVPPPTQSPVIPAPLTASIAAPASAPAPAPVVAPPVPAPATAAAPPAKSSQADQMARLKSLYSISKSTASSNASANTSSETGSSSGPGTPSTPTAPKISQPPPVQQQQAPQQQRQQQTTTQHAPTQYQNPQHKPQVYQQSQSSQPSNQRQQQPQQSRPPQQQPPQQEMQPPSRSQPQQRQQQPQQYSQSSSQRTQYSQQQQQQPQQTHHQRQSSSQPAQQHQQQQQQQMQHRQQVHRRGNVQHSSRSTSSQPQQLHQAAAVVDPFAPTPLSQIKQSNQHRSRTHHQQQPTQPSPRMPQQVVGGSSSSGTSSRERDIKKQKEKFLMFTRVLIKYLEQKDKRMHHQAKIIIKDCAERNKRQEPGYESVTESMKRRLKELVGDHYWKKANDYLIHFIEQKRRQHAAAAAAGGSSSGGGSRSSGGGGSSSSAQQQQQQQLDAHKRRRLKEQEDRERLRLQSLEKERLKKEQASKQRPTVTSPLIAIQQEIQEKREQITMQTAKVPTGSKASKSKSAARSTAAAIAANTTAATKGKGGGTKKAPRRKSAGESSTASARRGSAGGSKTASAAAASATAAAPVKRVVVEEPPREYKELMELIDHAVDYDWPSVGQLLGTKSDLKLTEEEHLLLYGDLPEPSAKSKKRTSISKTASGKTPQGQDVSVKIEGQVDRKVNRDVRPGWGRSNVLSARSAWARVRLRELKIRKKAASNPSPIVAGGLLSLSTTVAQDQQRSTSAAAIPIVDAATSATKPEIEGSWVNEETAEQDAALSLLSAGCQIYLKGVLQKTIQCARQRQNLDGIRLWHQQYTFSKGTSTTSSNINSTALNLSKDDKSKKPPLSLRLGCDVSRQVAQAQGNAAMTVKRMEEALERQTGIPMRARELNNDTLQEATSMGDLSWRPLLKEGAEKAEYQAKRSFEVFGGKEAKDPPLGRVPKKAKLQVEDLLMGSELSIGGPYHKAYTASSFISF